MTVSLTVVQARFPIRRVCHVVSVVVYELIVSHNKKNKKARNENFHCAIDMHGTALKIWWLSIIRVVFMPIFYTIIC